MLGGCHSHRITEASGRLPPLQYNKGHELIRCARFCDGPLRRDADVALREGTSASEEHADSIFRVELGEYFPTGLHGITDQPRPRTQFTFISCNARDDNLFLLVHTCSYGNSFLINSTIIVSFVLCRRNVCPSR
jgi:hypothetical protein